MPARRARRRRTVESVTPELELLPMINVFIAIIPLLLLSAAFVQVAVIPTGLPRDPEGEVVTTAADAPEADVTPSRLCVRVRSGRYLVERDGEALLSIPRPAAGPGHAAEADAARAQLSAALKGLAPEHAGDREVRIVAEPTTRYEDLIDVMDIARAAGLPGAALADEPQGAS